MQGLRNLSRTARAHQHFVRARLVPAARARAAQRGRAVALPELRRRQTARSARETPERLRQLPAGNREARGCGCPALLESADASTQRFRRTVSGPRRASAPGSGLVCRGDRRPGEPRRAGVACPQPDRGVGAFGGRGAPGRAPRDRPAAPPAAKRRGAHFTGALRGPFLLRL